MVKIYLVQHGKALPKNVDPDRRLSEDGIRETENIARYLYKLGIKIEKIIHSGKLRARMTAEIIGNKLEINDISAEKGLEPLDNPNIWREKLDNIDKNVMIVGHLPHLSKLTSLLLNINTEVVAFRYSGVLCLERRDDMKWIIKWYITPEIIK